MYAVELHNLSKTYPGGKQAVQNVSLELEPGEVFGFLGPNGAGKTTTVKLFERDAHAYGRNLQGAGIRSGAGTGKRYMQSREWSRSTHGCMRT